MAYLEQTNPNLLDDINKKKEFRMYQKSDKDFNIIPRFLLRDIIGEEHGLILHSYQKFVANFLNPNTPYTRLFLQWSPGLGKTIASLSIALRFINYYNKEQEVGSQQIGSVWIIGFTHQIFKADLIKFPEFGFISESELDTYKKLKAMAFKGSTYDRDKLNEFRVRINRRLNNRQGNGFFKFIGYKALLNRIFLSRDKDINLVNLDSNQIAKLILENKVVLNTDMMDEMKNSLFICDEIHNVYNSAEKNNWGVALQTILDWDPSIRALLLSATPINNNPSELIDFLNLLTSRRDYEEFKKQDFFTDNEELKPEKIYKLREILSGRVSFITNNDPKFFPAKGFIGETLPGISYLKFIRCPMSQFHYKTYKNALNNIEKLSSESRYILDFALPATNTDDPWSKLGIYKINDIRSVYRSSSIQWRNKFKLFYDENKDIITGDILNNTHGHLSKISAKYSRMVNDIHSLIKNRKGKIFIYHNVIHMSGVIFIGEVLNANGFISETGMSTENTICAICGNQRRQHSREQLVMGGEKTILFHPNPKEWVESDADVVVFTETEDYWKNKLHDYFIVKYKNLSYFSKDLIDIDEVASIIENKRGGSKNITPNHKFMPCRYTLVHSNTNRKIINNNIDAFNSITNTWGEHIMILVGGKIMKESINLVAVQNLFIMSRPDNISTMLQINGRAIRTNSHIALPPENRLVNISIYTSSLPNNDMSYEEQRYKQKVDIYKTIQKIELILHDVAIDKLINYDIIWQPDSEMQKKQYYQLDILPYSTKQTKVSLQDLSLDTFNAYYGEEEVRNIRIAIKKAFVEISPVWDYEQLFQVVKQMPLNWNTELISENNFILALNSLLFEKDSKYVDIIPQSAHMTLYDKFYSYLDNFIYLFEGNKYGIVNVGQYYMMMPIVLNEITIDMELPYRIHKSLEKKSISLKNYLINDLNSNYGYKKEQFIKRWENIDIVNLDMAICEYGSSFHKSFAEECIEYLFNVWTNSNQVKSNHHIFYIKMLYYYDLRKIIIWAHTINDRLFSKYKKWLKPVSEKLISGIKIDNIKDSDLQSTSGLLNLLKTSINKNNTKWISTGMISDFNSKVKQTLALFDGSTRKKIVGKIPANYLPVGHFIGKVPRFYNPDRGGWYDDMSYIENTSKYKENNIIIGYDDKTKTGINVKFKIRNPIQNIRQFKDTRQIERGSICVSKSKQYLYNIATKLEIPTKSISSDGIEELCMKIRTRLIYYELKARMSGSNLKYFYFLHEIKPETLLEAAGPSAEDAQ